jgi:hypothetical protein
MKYLKKYNEELLPSTYRTASTKLRTIGHTRRSAEMEAYAKELEEKEKIRKNEIRRQGMISVDPFHLIFLTRSYGNPPNEKVLCEGLFYIEPSFDWSWFQDMYADWENDNSSYTLSLPFEFGTMPADEETQQKFDAASFSEEAYEGVHYGTRMWLNIINVNETEVSSSGKYSWEGRDGDEFVFGSRQEAIRFKKCFADAVEGKTQWGKSGWAPEGIQSNFNDYFKKDKEWRERENKPESYFTKDDMPKLAESIRRMSLNQIYRN